MNIFILNIFQKFSSLSANELNNIKTARYLNKNLENDVNDDLDEDNGKIFNNILQLFQNL